MNNSKLLLLLCLAAVLSVCLAVLALGSGYWDGVWGPATITVRLRDSTSGQGIPAESCAVGVRGLPPDGYSVTGKQDEIRCDFQRRPVGGRIIAFIWWTGAVSFDITYRAAGYQATSLSYPKDFAVVNYNTIDKYEWAPPVEEYGRTLYLEPTVGR
jgi:hypothetical protein